MKAGRAKLQWQPVNLPGQFMPWNQRVANQTKFEWARRSFTINQGQAEGSAVLCWNRIGSGSAAFINDQLVRENEPTGPYQVNVPRGVLFPAKPDRVQNSRRRRRTAEPEWPSPDPVEGPAMDRAEKIL